MPLHPDVVALVLAMRRLQAHLATHDEVRWAQIVGQCADWAENSDAAGLYRFLSLFGGMGSLNDLVLHHDGKPLIAENEELNRLLGEAWTLADRLQDERRHVEG